MITCTACGTDNEGWRKFCSECGSGLAAACAACGTANAPGTKFCGECGAALAPESPAAAAATATSERRLVSVLFADLVGFTSLSESRDPEEVRELLSRYFDTCRRLIERYGGVVEKFIGDAVMAVWGTPVAREDDAERAVRAALELTAAVTSMGQEANAPELSARAGVMTGEAAVNLAAVGEGMVAGDLVNTASRVQASAPPGGVFVGEATRRSSEAAIEYEDAGIHEMKGKSEPMPLWRAVRVVGAIRGLGRSEGLEPPFLGRDRELRLIKDVFHTSVDAGRAQLVTVLAPAGVGKSRLQWEFFKYIDGLAADTRWHRGRCLAYGEGVTYWALAEMVRTNASIVEGEELSSALPKLRDAVAAAIADPEERRWVEPRLASLLGLEEGPSRDREDLFGAWRLFYERLAEAMPTVMVFEDIHWADASLLDFIEYLLEWSRSYPLFVLAVGRPDVSERRPEWGRGVRNATTLHLDPLPDDTMREILRAIVPGLPDDVATRVLQRAAGVPLYAVETLRMLLDRGLLVREDGVVRPAGPIGDLDVPETLHALIAARLDGLPPEERALVQGASVLGKTFTPGALAAVQGIPLQETERLLNGLVRKEVLTVVADRFSPDRGQHSFVGDLVRFVAYETLSRRERRARHLAVAQYLVSTFEEDDVVEVVASHYLQAYQVAPEGSEAEEIRAKAIEALRGAGERAASLGAADEAVRYFEEAIELADDPGIRGELLTRAGSMSKVAGRLPQGRELLERAIEILEHAGLAQLSARAAVTLADIYRGQAEAELALSTMQHAFEVLSTGEVDADLAMVAAELARATMFAGDVEAAWRHVEQALTWAEMLGIPTVLAEAMNTKSLILRAMGRAEEARVLIRHALGVALEHDLGAPSLRAYNNLIASVGEACQTRDELEAAVQGVELARRLGNGWWERRLLSCEINPLVLLGRWAEVDDLLESLGPEDDTLLEVVYAIPMHVARGALEFATAIARRIVRAGDEGDIQTRGTELISRAQVHLAERRWQEALDAGVSAWRMAREHYGTRDGNFVEGICVALEAAIGAEDLDAIDRHLDVIDALRPGEVSASLGAHAIRLRAQAAALRGDLEGAQAGFERAIEHYGDLGWRFWQAATRQMLGEWLSSIGLEDDAAAQRELALPVFEDLRATPWIERARGIRAEAAAASSA